MGFAASGCGPACVTCFLVYLSADVVPSKASIVGVLRTDGVAEPSPLHLFAYGRSGCESFGQAFRVCCRGTMVLGLEFGDSLAV